MDHLEIEEAESLRQDRRIADQLRRTWPVFFNKFGRLTEVQRVTIPRILTGEDVLVCAPTASGKTEAVCAPLMERNLCRLDDWTILYISPTRALVNDLFERLCQAARVLGVSIARRTGDHRDRIEEARILLTTPESFDSMLCRGRLKNNHILSKVVALVLDEIHFLYGQPRGEQLRWLIKRLQRLRSFSLRKGWTSDDSLQIIALSATISTPELIGQAYLSANARIVEVNGGRSIETVTVDSESPGIESALPKYVENLTTTEKILVFSNSRERVDDLSYRLKAKLIPLGYRVMAHHGSLSKKVREEAEAAMKKESRIILVATSTLEIGIDIGDIDLVVLDGPAPDIQALLQRIGRGNRRTQQTRLMPCSGNLVEVLIHSSMIECARDGWIMKTIPGPCYCVARQQLASYIFQSHRRSRQKEYLFSFLNDCMPPPQGPSILEHLLDEKEFLEDADGIRLGTEWLDSSERGDIHSNIEDRLGMTVVDDTTGSLLAQGISFCGGKTLQIGGNLLKVKKWEERKIEVRESTSGDRPDAVWSYCCRAWAKGSGQQEALKHYLGISEDEWPLLPSTEYTFVFHLGGSRRKAVLDMILKFYPRIAMDIKINEWFLTFPGSIRQKPEWLLSTGPALIEIMIAENLSSLERTLGRPKANKKLPVEVRIDEIRRWLRLEEELEQIKKANWIKIEDQDTTDALNILKNDID